MNILEDEKINAKMRELAEICLQLTEEDLETIEETMKSTPGIKSTRAERIIELFFVAVRIQRTQDKKGPLSAPTEKRPQLPKKPKETITV